MLSIIIATKQPVWHKLNLCLLSIASLESANKIKVILIYSEGQCHISDKLTIRFEDFVSCEMDSLGVYAAYNKGLGFIREGYVLFLGDDDIVLPGLDQVISKISKDRICVDLVGCESYMQLTRKLSSLPTFKCLVLWKNWNHQCCLYNSRLFKEHEFSEEYRIQADHEFNIKVMSSRSCSWVRLHYLISHFTSGGCSSTQNDLRFRKRMPLIAKKHFGWCGYLFCLSRRVLADSIKGRPSDTI